MKGILDHAGPSIQEWWTPSAGVELTPQVKAMLAEAAGELAGAAPIADWERWRDEALVKFLRLQGAMPQPLPSAVPAQEESSHEQV